MKKILSIFALAALMLGMASCNSNDPESTTKRFTIEVTNIAATEAHVTITPPDEQMSYNASIMSYNMFKNIKEENVRIFLTNGGSTTGTIDAIAGPLWPNTKYTVLAGEIAGNGDVIGDIEHYTFKTENVEAKTAEFVEEGSSVPFEGEVSVSLFDDDLPMTVIEGSCDMDSEAKITLSFVVWGDKKSEQITSDDLSQDSEIIVEVGDERGKGVIYNTEFTGYHNLDTDKYWYDGWCDVMLQNDVKECYRIPFHMTCSLVED